MLGDAVPAGTNGLTLVQQRSMVLVLVHHGVEAENSCGNSTINHKYSNHKHTLISPLPATLTSQINNLLLCGISQSLFVFITHINGDLLLGVQYRSILGRWFPFLAAHHTSNERFDLGYIGRFQRLFIDVIDEFLAV